MDKPLIKSLKKKRPVKLLTNHPDGQTFEGIVICLTKSLIIIREVKDYEIDGVVAFPRQAISGVIEQSDKDFVKELMKHYDNDFFAEETKWLKKVKNFGDLVAHLYKNKDWIAVESVDVDDSAVLVGPIQSISKKSFNIHSSPLAEKKKKIRKVDYRDLFKVEMYSSYISYIRDYMNLSV